MTVASGNEKIQASKTFNATTKRKNQTGENSKSGLSSLVSYGSDSDEESSENKNSVGNNQLPFWAAYDYKNKE